MKSLLLILVFVSLFFLSSTSTFADLIPGPTSEFFMGYSVAQRKPVGVESFLEEFVWPRHAPGSKPAPINETLEIDDYLILIGQSSDVEFNGAEAGDPWWNISTTVFRGRFLWNAIFIHIKGSWNPAAQESHDNFGRIASRVVRVRFTLFTQETLVLYHVNSFTILSPFGAKISYAPAKQSIVLKPVTCMPKSLATTWGRMKHR